MVITLGRLAACGLLAVAPVLVTGTAAAAAPEPAGVSVSGSAGCAGKALTRDAGGAELGLLDTAAGIAAAKDKALLVDPGGTITYAGSSTAVVTDLTWTVSVAGVQVASGSSANDKKATKAAGTVDAADYLPVSITGTVLADATVTGTGGSCTGEAWVTLDGNPWTSVNGLAGLALTAAGVVGLAFVRPRRLAGSAGGAA